MCEAVKILLLAGTGIAREAAAILSRLPNVHALASLAGATGHPAPLSLPTRVGGFGGVDGLRRYLGESGISGVLDATHAFANGMSANARLAAERSGIAYAALVREPWQPEPGDRWIEATDEVDALDQIPDGSTAFLALGRKHVARLATRGRFRAVLRVAERQPDDEALIEALGGASSITLIHGSPDPDPDTEAALIKDHGVQVVVARNSGGPKGYGKIAAARHLGLPVIMIRRPPDPGGPTLCLDQIAPWVAALSARPCAGPSADTP